MNKTDILENIRGLIFDVDGTLTDSNDQHAYAFRDAFLKMGWNISFDSIRPLIGMGSDHLVPAVLGRNPSSTEQKEIEKLKKDIFEKEYLKLVKKFPGARELISSLKDNGLKIVIGSSAGKEELKKLLQIAGVEDLLDGVTSSDDAENSKPDPDIIRAAQVKLDLPAPQILMVGDTPYDIEAASKAGVRTIAFRSGGWKDSKLAGALAIYDGPWDWFAKEAK